MNKLILYVTYLLIIGCQTNSEETTKTNISEKISTKSPYIGSWPHNPDKDIINNPGFGSCPKANGCECDSNDTCPQNSECTQLFRGKYCVPTVGAQIPRLKAIDQFGDEFDLYDLANQGKPILLEIGNGSASACKYFSAWRSHVSDDAKQQKWWKSKFEKVRDLIDNEEIYWVHVMHTGEDKNPATSETVRLWHERYPHDNIIILADPDKKMKTWVRPTGMPCMLLIDEDMILQVHALRGIEDALDGVYEVLDSK